MEKIFIGISFFLTVAFAKSFHATAINLPINLQNKMRGVTWFADCPVALNQLVLIKLNYWGFDNKSHIGALIVNKRITKQVIKIFHKLYEARFPIAKMQPMYIFRGNDKLSMQANNTSAFNCRKITGSKNIFSRHAYGTAIDINPQQNPYVKGNLVLPKSGKTYLNRNQHRAGMIVNNGLVVRIFKKYHWQWGGHWKSLKDYQHFQVKL